jgi:hypothetical protein
VHGSCPFYFRILSRVRSEENHDKIAVHIFLTMVLLVVAGTSVSFPCHPSYIADIHKLSSCKSVVK